MILRKIKNSDSAQIAKLLGQLGYPTVPTVVAKRFKVLKTKFDQILVVVDKGEAVGFVSAHLIPLIHEDGFLSRITALVVDEGYRGKGIGKKLVQKAEIWAKKQGAVKSEITSGAMRKKAHLFYEKMGYQEYRKRLLKRFKI